MDNKYLAPIIVGSISVISLLAYNRLYNKLSSFEERLSSSTVSYTGEVPQGAKRVRVFIDGTFDLTHYGHFNAIRQAATYGDLYVGLDSQIEIETSKGPTILTYDERKTMIQNLRWVTGIIDDSPYSMTPEFLELLFTKYNIDFVMHGDDPCVVNGVDCYGVAKAMGKFKYIKRTEGISTTDLIGRMLSISQDNSDLYLKSMSMLPTIRRLSLFVGGIPRSPNPEQKVILVTGSFDVFHAGHVKFLEEARKYGDYLYVGLHDDYTIRQIKGRGYPIMNIHERALSVLANKYVDDVILGCPWIITKELLTSLNVSFVVSGKIQDYQGDHTDYSPQEQFKIPKEMGLFIQIESPSTLVSSHIVDRVLADNEALKKKYELRRTKEQSYYSNEMGKILEQ